MKERKKSTVKSDLKRVDQMTDDDIDYSDIPETDAAFWSMAEPVLPKSKKQITLRIDDEVLEYFKKSGSGYQSRINAVLKSYVKAHRSHR